MQFTSSCCGGVWGDAVGSCGRRISGGGGGGGDGGDTKSSDRERLASLQ